MTEYNNLKPWTYPADYGGQTWYGWYAVAGQSRDSDALERSNYRTIFADLKALNTELAAADIDPRNLDYDNPEDSTVCDTSCNHWAVGWVETVYVHSSNTAACELADKILDGLSDYPVYDDSDFSEEERTDEEESWENWARCDFNRALEGPFENWLDQRMEDSGVDSDEAKTRIGVILDAYNDLDLSTLFYETADALNVYWEHGSDGASIDVEKVANAVTNEQLLDLCGENESAFAPKRYCEFNPFQGWLPFVTA